MFNLGEKVFAVVDGEITEIRKVGEVIKYTVTMIGSKEFVQAIVTEDDMAKKGDEYGTAKDVIAKRK